MPQMNYPRKISLVLPLYKPHEGWTEHVCTALTPIYSFMRENRICFQVVIANDGSPMSYYPDNALTKIKALCDEFLFSTYEKNHGKGYSLRHAVAMADGEYILYTDGDFPFGWECIVAACKKLAQGADIVMGTRGQDYSKALHPLRKVLSRTVRVMNRIILGMPMKYLDTQAGMKAFKRGRGKELFLATTVDTFVFDLEFILNAWRERLQIETVSLKIRDNIKLSRMGYKILLRELRYFILILLKHWMRLLKQKSR